MAKWDFGYLALDRLAQFERQVLELLQTPVILSKIFEWTFEQVVLKSSQPFAILAGTVRWTGNMSHTGNVS